MNTATRPAPGRPGLARLAIQLLVVDDDDVDRERVLRLLAGSTLDVQGTQAASAADALRLVHEREFDCVMLDHHLGEANGTDLMPALQRASQRECPIIMVTGAGNETVAVRALREGAADYLSKAHLDTDVLVGAIERALERQRMQQQIDSLLKQVQQRVDEQAAVIVERERDLRAILDHTPSVIGYWDAQLRCRFGNEAHKDWSGLPSRGLPGRHLREVIGEQRFNHIRPQLDTVLLGRPVAFEQSFPAIAGAAQQHTQFNLQPDMGDDGQVRGFYATIADITAIRQAQSRAEELARLSDAAIEHSPVGCGVYRADGLCVMSNQALASAAGVDPGRLRALALWPWLGERAPALLEPARATLDDGLPRTLPAELRGAAGTPVQLACTLARITLDGQPHLLLYAHDVTEQTQALDALVSARDRAEVAVVAKSAFLANMSHEVRTPMTAIVGLSRLALQDKLSPTARNDIDKVHGAAVALMELLDGVLDYSKIEAGHMRLEHAPFNLGLALQRTADLFSASVYQRRLEFVVDLAPTVPTHLVGDAQRLSQVINNLVGNAVKFTERGHVRLAVREQPSTDPLQCKLRISVQDSGIGIDPLRCADLFNAFTQADGSIGRRFGGTGLGLAICKRLVEMMGGRLGVESAPGQGSEFWFVITLPRSEVEPAESAEPKGVAGLRVLLVEDFTDAGRVIEAQLQTWKVLTARSSNANRALRLIERARHSGTDFDLLLLEWQDSQVDALRGLIRCLNDNNATRRLPLIALLTPDSRDAQNRAIGCARVDTVLVKPVLAAPLLEVLRKAAARRSTPSPAVPRLCGAPPVAVAPCAARTLAARSAQLSGARVLLAEDNLVNQIVAQRMLEALGLEVQVVSDGAEALAALQESGHRPFDAVLMDMHMPVLDGIQAARIISRSEQWAGVPVIAMTAATMSEDRASCLAAGMVDYVTKPVLPQVLLETLLRWIPRSESPQGSGSAFMPFI